jgi:arylsulfatase A
MRTVSTASPTMTHTPPASAARSPLSFTARNVVSIVIAGAAASILAPRSAAQAGPSKPNIILIVADDMGYGDVGPYDHDGDPSTPNVTNTPRLDQLATQSIQLTDFYVCAPVCSPSRAGILTGRNCSRVGIRGVLGPNAHCGLKRSEITLAEVLKTRGYATEIVGKWHLGSEPESEPPAQGFDSFYGVLCSNDMNHFELMHDGVVIDPAPDQSALMQHFLVEAESFVSAQAAQSKPFFLYLPTVVPHVPVYVGSAFDGATGRGLYADCINELDWSIGHLLDHLDALGIAGDTIVVVTSDNGPWDNTHFPPAGTPDLWRWVGGSAGPLRGSKGMVYEGGIREPLLARWPGHFGAGSVSANPAVAMDLFTTLALCAGATVPSDRVLDGVDIRPILTGTGARGTDDFFFYEITAPCDTSLDTRKLWALRSGNWKLHFNSNVTPVELYDLSADIGETTPLVLPAVVSMLLDKAHAFDCSLDAALPPPQVAGNLASGRPTSASSSVECQTSAQAVDSLASTSWASAPGEDQWISVDLGTTSDVQAMVLDWAPSYATAFEIDVSNNAAQWTTIHGTRAGTGGHEVIMLGAYARFVRLHATCSSAGTGYSISELAILGDVAVPRITHTFGHAH